MLRLRIPDGKLTAHQMRGLADMAEAWDRASEPDNARQYPDSRVSAERHRARAGHLTRLDTAFSRDQDQKVYVQDRMIGNSRLLWNWLQDGASVYVCGDAEHMGKDVHVTLRKIAEQEGSMSAESADHYVASLKEQHRYHRDLY